MMRPVFVISLIFIYFFAPAQNIKHFEAYIKQSDGTSRYVIVLDDNSIWWYSPEQNWKKSSTGGLPEGYDIKHFCAFSKSDGNSRYVAVLSDNSVWWYAPETLKWSKSSTEGLPGNYNIRFFKAYPKDKNTRYVAVLDDGSIFWYSPEQAWQKSSMEGYPQ